MNEKETGQFIAEIRKQKNMTQRELAEQIGVSDKTISKWETGKSIPDLPYLKNLCTVLGVTINELIAGQRLSEQDYSRKAEETIMNLMQENKTHKMRNVLMNMIGLVLVMVAVLMFMLFTQDGLQGIAYYLDILSLLVVLLPTLGILLITRKKRYVEILKLLDQTLIPVGVVATLALFIMEMQHLYDPAAIGPSISVCFLSLLYVVIAKLIVVVLLIRRGEK